MKQGPTVAEMAALQAKISANPEAVRDALAGWKAELVAQGALSDEQARQVGVLRGLEAVGLLTEDGLPAHLALNPGPVSNDDETEAN